MKHQPQKNESGWLKPGLWWIKMATYELWQVSGETNRRFGAYSDKTRAFNALLEGTVLQFGGCDKPLAPIGGFTWTETTSTDGVVVFDRLHDTAYYYVICGDQLYTTDGYDVVEGDMRTGVSGQVVYPPVQVEKVRHLYEKVAQLQEEHAAAATTWIDGWREATGSADSCPFMKLVEMPGIKTCLSYMACANQMKKDLVWMAQNPPGAPDPETPVQPAQRWEMRSPGYYRKSRGAAATAT